jgi:hypothetical protein
MKIDLLLAHGRIVNKANLLKEHQIYDLLLLLKILDNFEKIKKKYSRMHSDS